LASSDTVADFAAGAALGGLTGLLVGLSTASVTGTILSSVVAIGTAFIGLAGEPKLAGGAITQMRIIGFATAMIVALFGGVWTRTHDFLSPTPQQLYDQLRAADFPPEEARDVVKLIRFGLKTDRAGSTMEVDPEAGKNTRTTLYSTTPEWCADLVARQDQPMEEQIEWLSRQGDEYDELASRLRNLPPDRQVAVAQAAPFYICEVN
jgi:hypothetical protein